MTANSKLLKDPSPEARRRAALALAEANDADAIPVLIDLLAELPADKRQAVEECLTKLAGEWAPISQLASDDSIARKIRRDAWMVWWRNTNGQALLAVVGEHTLTPARRQKVKELIAKLGDDEFLNREAADTELYRLGRIALPQLRAAIANKDLEASTRARRLIERIEQEPARQLPSAAVRLLALRKPPGAAQALLAYLPFAEEENRIEEIKKSLAGLAIRDGKLDAALVRALADESPSLRVIAAEALVKGGGRDGRSAVRKLLYDDASTVRLRVALALTAAGDKDGVPVLIDLLAVLPDEHVGQAEEALQQLAGESAPETPLGSAAAEKKKCRDAWAAWWKVNAPRVDLRRLKEQRLLGYTLICDTRGNRVYEIDRQGKERWAIRVANPVDAVVVPGNRVLIAHHNTRCVTECDFTGKTVWTKQVAGFPINVQRLANGNTFIAAWNGPLLEVDRAGKEVYSIAGVPGNTLAACRSRQGDIFCTTMTGQCLTLDTTGKILKSFNAGPIAGMNGGALDLLANGRLLIARVPQNKVVEFDRDGKVLRQVDTNATTATALPNGHILVASRSTHRVFELDRGGKVVWEHKGSGDLFRARRR